MAYELPSDTVSFIDLSNNSTIKLIQYYSHVALKINKLVIMNRSGIEMMAVDGFQWVRPSRVKNQQGGSWNAVGTKEEPESDAQPFSMESTSLRS